ncbi:hypothetical protein C4141_04035 [Clostridioides difficile]|nr:hypothetical protein [Clostridioides difficile]CCL22616.1 conserved hypothetical protein [Clostridioides difficile T15]EGT3773206.1 hypothetical protein [Clostridioides difficile]EGT3803765.1 hypothetical protein [Clostridioides difficile]EGT3862375.1 hypothetical protein [Clostridioides difficile]
MVGWVKSLEKISKNLFSVTRYNIIINVTSYRKEVNKIATKSRAEYMKNCRKDKRGFSVLLDKEKLDKFDEVLEEKNLTKKEWLEEKIDEELEQKE